MICYAKIQVVRNENEIENNFFCSLRKTALQQSDTKGESVRHLFSRASYSLRFLSRREERRGKNVHNWTKKEKGEKKVVGWRGMDAENGASRPVVAAALRVLVLQMEKKTSGIMIDEKEEKRRRR